MNRQDVTDRMGVIQRDGETASIHFERRLAHPIEAVYDAVTNPEKRAKWFGPTTMDPRVGGRIATTPEGPDIPAAMRGMSGTITAWEPPRVFEYESVQGVAGRTVKRFELTADEGGTLLRFTISRMVPETAEGFIPGAHAYMDRLEALLAGEELPDWQQRYSEVENLYKGASR